MHRNPSASTELMALGKEAFASVSLASELLMFTPKLIPERMKSLIVGTMNIVTESVGEKGLAGVYNIIYRVKCARSSYS